MAKAASPLKQQAHELIDHLPDTASWEDVAYEVELRASIERGLADARAGRLIAVEDLMKELGIAE
jgi:predicted transcriptional regulator